MKKKVGTALVVGAGISGIRTALDLAEVGYGVTLIDRAPHLGGILSQLDYQFPTDRCGMCKMLPLVDRDASSQYCLRKGLFHENIDIKLSTELTAVEGDPGHFQVKLRQKPSWVDPDRCVGCAECVAVCPVDVPDAFNAGLAHRKAIYLPVPHAIPNPYLIDVAACTRCGACEKVCPTGAIRLSEQERKKFRILVVDDELIIRDSLRAWLDDEEGFSVETAESGPDALGKINDGPYHLMLLDIKMPGMDGVEVLKKAKEMLPEMEVVMMTAYATVETAVAAMKIGAFDYLIKPFDTDVLIPKVLKIYEDLEASQGLQLEVNTLVLAGGTAYYDPSGGKNTFGYKQFPGVVTSLEFERIMSGSGPCRGALIRPEDGRPVGKIAWIQCVGSRDLQTNADFCSNICCMHAIKEAQVAKEKFGSRVETVIFYMDLRTFGKPYQRYRDEAERAHGVRFERGRVHSVTAGDAGQSAQDLVVRYVNAAGEVLEARFDMIVLSVGQRPAPGTPALAGMLDLPLNEWGFCQTEPFSMTRSGREGVFVGGAYSGLKDISESVIQASAAALSASRTIHNAGGSLSLEVDAKPAAADVSREMPRTLVVVCTCGTSLAGYVRPEGSLARLAADPAVDAVEFVEQVCTAVGWEALGELVEKHHPNRVLVGACLPYVYARKIRELAARTGIDPALVDVVDIRTPGFDGAAPKGPTDLQSLAARIESNLLTGLVRLKRANPMPVATVRIRQRALVVGGGIAGMTAALAVADHGFGVDLIEKEAALGGNLNWLQHTLEGHDARALLTATVDRVEKHPRIQVHTGAQVMASAGRVGNFHTSIENSDGSADTIEHGAVILATGAVEASTAAYGHDQSDRVITQKALEQKLEKKEIDPEALSSVVMIQCVGSREEPRNYCSRICCLSALKHALALKEKNPDISVYIFYRDIMSYGFAETCYTRARRAGVVFIQYEPGAGPEVVTGPDGVTVRATDPILGRAVEIEADLLVLATGVVPTLPADLAAAFGAALDRDGFFQEAETKWRPVDSIREGVFACGLAHSPRSISEAITTAEAAAQRSLRILSREHLPSGKVVASVRSSLCSLCERCIDACPYEARSLDNELEKIVVNPVMCQGCGSCATVCPNGASVLEGFQEAQMLETIDAALTGAFN